MCIRWGKMLSWLKRRSEGRRKARDLYGAIVAQARQPAFFSEGGVPDTPTGRYEMIAVHLFVVLEQMKRPPNVDAELGQDLVEAFVTDMDDSLREMGTGDMAVPKKVRQAAGGLYARSKLYGEAIASGEPSALSRALARQVYGIEEQDRRSDRLADYVRQAVALSSAGSTSVEGVNLVRFPDAAVFVKDGE